MARASLFAASALLVAAAACGPLFGVDFDGRAAPDDQGTGTSPTDPPGGGTSQPGAPDDAGPDGGDGDAALKDSGPTSKDGGGEAGPDAATGPIDPIVVGHAWTFQVTEIGAMPACPTGTHDWTVLDTESHDGKLAFAIRPFCTGLAVAYYVASGDVVQRDDLGVWEVVTDAPVTNGHTWTNDVSSYQWHDIGSYTVPAGTFSSCFDLVDLAGPTHTVFCRGVGPVFMAYRDINGDGYDATLTKKNF